MKRIRESVALTLSLILTSTVFMPTTASAAAPSCATIACHAAASLALTLAGLATNRNFASDAITGAVEISVWGSWAERREGEVPL